MEASPCLPAAVGQNASLAPDINFCAENPVGAGVTNGFYLLLENTAPPHPCTRHTQALVSILQSPTQGAGSRELSVNVKNYAFDILYETHHALTISPVIFFSDAAALQMSFWP